MTEEPTLEAIEIAEIFILLGLYRQILLAEKVIEDFENLKVTVQVYKNALKIKRRAQRVLNGRLEVDAAMTRVITVFEQAKPYVSGTIGL